MKCINGTGACELTDWNLVDLESCFDPLFYPPDDFEKAYNNQRRKENPFTCTKKYGLGNTVYIVETTCDGTEPLPFKLRRLIFSDRNTL